MSCLVRIGNLLAQCQRVLEQLPAPRSSPSGTSFPCRHGTNCSIALSSRPARSACSASAAVLIHQASSRLPFTAANRRRCKACRPSATVRCRSSPGSAHDGTRRPNARAPDADQESRFAEGIERVADCCRHQTPGSNSRQQSRLNLLPATAPARATSRARPQRLEPGIKHAFEYRRMARRRGLRQPVRAEAESSAIHWQTSSMNSGTPPVPARPTSSSSGASARLPWATWR